MIIRSQKELLITPVSSITTSIVGSNLLECLDQIEVLKSLHASKFLVLTDEPVFKLYGTGVIQSLHRLNCPVLPSIIASGELQKNLKSMQRAIEPFMQSGFDKNAVLVCLGGGVVTDLGGFISAIVLRGIKSVYLPTTLLSQIDASIGGKTGIDYISKNGMLYKNMLGTFTQPRIVISDTDVLSSLPQKELRSGIGEMVKYHLGWATPSLEDIKSCLDISSLDELKRDSLISTCQNIKFSLVEKDPLDMLGIREMLNIGHTFAHGIESATNAKVSHGEAVAIGLVACGILSHKVGLCSAETRDYIKKSVLDLTLPVHVENVRIEQILTAMRLDKKGGTFVLFEDIGKLQTGVRVDRSLVIQVLEEICI